MIMNVKEASQYLKISRWLCYEMVKRGEIPFFKCGKAIRFRIEELDEWIKTAQ